MISGIKTATLPGLGLALASLAALVTSPALAAPAAPASQTSAKAGHNAQVNVTANGSYTLGNPAAPIQVTEYISYTCSHCAALHSESDAAMRQRIIPQGKVALTVSNLVRNPVDMTIALLAACGDPKSFFARHDAFLGSQETWLPRAAKTTPEQRARWQQGEIPERLRAIASDLGFYPMIARFGIKRSQAEQCLADQGQIDKVMSQRAAADKLQLTGTPGIVLNGKVLYVEENGQVKRNLYGDKMQVTEWKDMSRAIAEALAAHTAKQI